MEKKKTGANGGDMLTRIVRAYNTISRSINSNRFLKVELTSSQVKVLMSFSDRDSYNMGELSSFQGVSISTMTSMVDRLIQNGLIKRERDNADRRVVRVGLTSRGRKMVSHLLKIRRMELQRFLNGLSGGETVKFVKSIENVARFLTKAREKRQQPRHF